MELTYITQEIQNRILEFAHTLHRHPEISYQEFETTILLRKALEKMELEFPEEQPSTGVIALLQGGLPGREVAMY